MPKPGKPFEEGDDPQRGRGGARPGAGRKPTEVSQLLRLLKVAEIDVLVPSPNPKTKPSVVKKAIGQAAWDRLVELMFSLDEKVALAATKDMLNRVFGRVPLAVTLTGEFNMTATIDAILAAQTVAASARRKVEEIRGGKITPKKLQSTDAGPIPEAGEHPELVAVPRRAVDVPADRGGGGQGPRGKPPAAPRPVRKR